MAKLKKSELIPKSKLGIDFNLKICWNCLFWNPETGRCPNFEDKTQKQIRGEWRYSFFPYNHKCENIRLFGNMVNPRQ
jgi:hypothetical protein